MGLMFFKCSKVNKLLRLVYVNFLVKILVFCVVILFFIMYVCCFFLGILVEEFKELVMVEV